MRLACETRGSSLGLSNNVQDANTVNPLRSGVWSWSRSTVGAPNPITPHRHTRSFDKDEIHRLRLAELEALDKRRLQAHQKIECYHARPSRAFNKKVRPCSFQVGDQVLAARRLIIVSYKSGSKFTSKWDGPYVVIEVYTNGAYKIVDANGVRVGPINGKFMKRYYPWNRML